MDQTIEWAEVAAGVVVIADQDGRYWLYRSPAPEAGNPFTNAISVSATPATTQGLLDGALYAGLQTQPKTDIPVRLTLPQLIKNLAANYHTTHRTPSTFRAARRQFAASGRTALANFAEAKAVEETGHDRLALKDLCALGLPARAVVAAIRPPSALALTNYFAECSRAREPVACFGYAYCLERLATFRDRQDIERVQELCGPGVDATRFLRVHSSVGADADHVVEMIELVACLPAGERARVARAAYQTAATISRQTRLDEGLTDDAICRALKRIGAPLACLC